jgi:hypothetical protein
VDSGRYTASGGGLGAGSSELNSWSERELTRIEGVNKESIGKRGKREADRAIERQ